MSSQSFLFLSTKTFITLLHTFYGLKNKPKNKRLQQQHIKSISTGLKEQLVSI